MIQTINSSLCHFWCAREYVATWHLRSSEDIDHPSLLIYEIFIDTLQFLNLSSSHLFNKNIRVIFNSLFLTSYVTSLATTDLQINETIFKVTRIFRTVFHISICVLMQYFAAADLIIKSGSVSGLFQMLSIQLGYIALVAISFFDLNITLLDNEFVKQITAVCLIVLEIVATIYSPGIFLKYMNFAFYIFSLGYLAVREGSLERTLRALPQNPSVVGRLFNRNDNRLNEGFAYPPRLHQPINFNFSSMSKADIERGFPVNYFSENRTYAEYLISNQNENYEKLRELFGNTEIFFNSVFPPLYSWETHEDEVLENLKEWFEGKWDDLETLEFMWLVGRSEFLDLLEENADPETLQNNYRLLQERYPNQSIIIHRKTILEVPPEVPPVDGNPDLRDLLTCFDEISFSHPSRGIELPSVSLPQPNFWQNLFRIRRPQSEPTSFKALDIVAAFYEDELHHRDDPNEELQINKARLRDQLARLINNINNRVSHIGVPSNFREKTRFYDMLEKKLKHILVYCQSTDADPEKKAIILSDLATAGAHCGGRWREAIDNNFSTCSYIIPLTAVEKIHRLLFFLRKDIIQNGVGQGQDHYAFYPQNGMFSPHFDYYVRFLLTPYIGVLESDNLTLDDAGQIVGNEATRRMNNIAEHLKQFNSNYTSERILEDMVERINNTSEIFNEDDIDNLFDEQFTLAELKAYYPETDDNWDADALDLIDYANDHHQKLAYLKSSLNEDGTYKWSGHYNQKAVALLLTKLKVFTFNPLVA